ncbi:putative tfiiic transcription initiation factor complex subunits tfc3 protein [Phaeoacremonium minimum UCRPA7]|uniref:Putative tfiiic transcription initiation factor complex subunits tfc3 protein n=1 Tax=Phaeoacremonium minimum (strain UCR-PA7) TaxID=1286976 RepID=R8BHG4_PHAM7|nr:putative tfiiic transcription initiation factor complex subunits tfc3 protein [Phaeoacremonium minimum UCRPA7]EON98687.1 putative tfiiic transcription initiation factor complex subunits tfc3 protein [Phaeoacremonium minimum UCRPA7]
MKVSALRRFWKTVKKERLSFINDLTDKFQISFVEAYEKRELPPIDFDDVVSYDWPLLLKWTVGLTVQDIVLPGTRKELGDDSCIQTFATENRDWRESYHHWQRSVFNKFQDATSEAATVTLNRSSEQPLPNLMGIAQSWIRALCCTPIHRYTAMDIKNKFLSLGGQSETYINELLENAIIDLERAKIAIKNKSRALATGRPYRLNDHFLKHLDRYAQEEKYALASSFKAQLDETFRRGEIFSVPYLTNDGMILATLNLQAYGRIRVNSVGQPDVPFGFEPGNYETRKFPKSYLHWGLEISPTENYLFDEDIDALGVAKQSVLPRELGDSRLPLWCDFFGVLDNERWAKFLGSVFFMLATRGNMDAEAVSMALQPCVEVFEAEAIMGWAREVGLLQEVTTGGGLTVCEWWWLVVGRQIDREGAKYEGGEELQDEM